MTIWKDMQIEFVPREKQHSEYDWADISNAGERVGKVRCQIEDKAIVIYSINIYPEYSGHGYGRKFVEYCKAHFRKVIADRVRPTAVGFWEAMGFHNSADETWVYQSLNR